MILSAIVTSEEIRERFNVVAGLSRQTILALEDRVKSDIEVREVPVMDPEK